MYTIMYCNIKTQRVKGHIILMYILTVCAVQALDYSLALVVVFCNSVSIKVPKQY